MKLIDVRKLEKEELRKFLREERAKSKKFFEALEEAKNLINEGRLNSCSEHLTEVVDQARKEKGYVLSRIPVCIFCKDQIVDATERVHIREIEDENILGKLTAHKDCFEQNKHTHKKGMHLHKIEGRCDFCNEWINDEYFQIESYKEIKYYQNEEGKIVEYKKNPDEPEEIKTVKVHNHCIEEKHIKNFIDDPYGIENRSSIAWQESADHDINFDYDENANCGASDEEISACQNLGKCACFERDSQTDEYKIDRIIDKNMIRLEFDRESFIEEIIKYFKDKKD